ncbi:HYC_CC_PP family protein [Sphingobacterium psychroaquaticum]|uniref:Uncharacterized protein n=1 Tax=Sphingobacterium psychroaquaticum TaxID=561061 RepID=A0A1X7ILP0_9SPHI|nr:hypothetical protein [Sphingobacterium psychroaquaticum]QBQ41413.1 hypothetical protein E2P86_09690 [Sphingobacterium psychroaquaticum]SMG15458.1 hypothetical protein SAMN05660862_0961 [Sphingobacterium psychroaquaticum]
MKKLFVAILSLVYLVLSTGFTQYIHLCKGTAAKQISFTDLTFKNTNDPCPICTSKHKGLKEKKKDCCKHETEVVKVDDTLNGQSQTDQPVKFWGNAIPTNMLEALFDAQSLDVSSNNDQSYLTSKVPLRGNPLYIIHCSYRI